MQLKDKKIMHGMTEIAGQGYYSVKGLKDNHYDAKLILWKESPVKYPYDKCLQVQVTRNVRSIGAIFKILINAFKCAVKFDIFHFHFGYSLVPFNFDLPVLKFMNKRLIFEFHGSDIRQKEIAITANPYMRNLEFVDTDKILKRMKIIGKYADDVIIHDNELISHLPFRPTNWHIVPLRLDISRFNPEYPPVEKKEIVIVHAPSNRSNKGTEFIVAAAESLAKSYSINFILIEGMTQEQAFAQYRKADIIIDQINIGTYGVFAIEAMAMGKPVITYITNSMKQSFPESLPIMSANPDNIKNVLEELIINGELRNERGKEGRKYVEKYHNCDINARLLASIYEGTHVTKSGRAVFEEVEEVYGKR